MPKLIPDLALETVLTDERAFGLTQASPLQRAICRIIDGAELGEYADDPVVLRALGNKLPEPGEMPKWFLILAAIWSGKSLIAAACAWRATQTIDVSSLGPGHYPRFAVLSTQKDQARVILDHLIGRVSASPLLKQTMIGDPAAESVWFRHPSGMPIEVTVTAGARAGHTLLGRRMAGVVFDEAPYMVGIDEGVVNLESSLKAVRGRMLPGAQIGFIGSPHAPMGPVYEMVQKHFGKPTKHLVVIRARGPDMNPSQWTPEAIAELRASPDGEDTYRTDVLGEFLDPATAMFSSQDIERNTRAGPLALEPEAHLEYAACMDPATRGNAWTLVIGTTTGYNDAGATVHKIAMNHQWIGSKAKPLNVDQVFIEMAGILRPYRVTMVHSDQYAFDALAAAAQRQGITLCTTAITAELALELAENTKLLLAENRLELPPDPRLKADLLMASRRLTQAGVRLHLPKGAAGRHGDYVPAIGLLCENLPRAPYIPPQPKDRFRRLLDLDRNKGDHWEQIGERLVGRL